MLEPSQTLETLAILKKKAFESALSMAILECRTNIDQCGESDPVDAHLIKINYSNHLKELEAITPQSILCELPNFVLDNINEQLFLLHMAHDELMKDILKTRNAARTKK